MSRPAPTCYACDQAATGYCDRTHFPEGCLVPACDRHSDEWSRRLEDAVEELDLDRTVAETDLDDTVDRLQRRLNEVDGEGE